MSALGELPSVDAAIHADTTHERSETYAFAAKWTPWLEKHGVRVITVRAKAQTTNPVTGRTPPLYTLDKEGNKGKLFRTCTHRWKVLPQERWIRAEYKRLGIPRHEWCVEKWYGITLDEWHRMRDSDVSYISNVYPFMDAFDHPLTRHDVKRWLLESGLEIPVKSACIFCPFHNRDGWREIRDSGNGDWEKAIKVDRDIRYIRPGYLAFVNNQRVALDRVDLSTQQDHGQLTLWDEEECTGNCFL
jgi:hypothetical protein